MIESFGFAQQKTGMVYMYLCKLHINVIYASHLS